VQQSKEGLSSTRRFLLEDVAAGEALIIHSDQPLSSDAGLYLRGYAPDSAIAAMRDKLLSEGRVPSGIALSAEVANAEVVPPAGLPSEQTAVTRQ